MLKSLPFVSWKKNYENKRFNSKTNSKNETLKIQVCSAFMPIYLIFPSLSFVHSIWKGQKDKVSDYIVYLFTFNFVHRTNIVESMVWSNGISYKLQAAMASVAWKASSCNRKQRNNLRKNATNDWKRWYSKSSSFIKIDFLLFWFHDFLLPFDFAIFYST